MGAAGRDSPAAGRIREIVPALEEDEVMKRLGRKARERGTILILALMLSVVMVILTVPFIARFNDQFRTTEKSFDAVTAVSLAEAGAERAIWELNYGNELWTGWSGTNPKTLTLTNVTALGGSAVGNVTITVQNPTGVNQVIESTASVNHFGTNNITKTVRLVMELREPPLFDFGIFGNNGVFMWGHCETDSFDSRNGHYGGQNRGSGGDVGTNSTGWGSLWVGAFSTVDGDAVCGHNGDPDWAIWEGWGSNITGSETSLATPKELPAVPAPTGLPNRGALSVPQNGTVTISQSGRYSNFTLGRNSRLNITADCTLYISGNFNMLSNSEITIADGVNVEMYFGGQWGFENNARINNQSQDPTKLLMYGCQTSSFNLELTLNSDIYAGMYFPRSFLIMGLHSDLYGSIVGKNIIMFDHTKVHYDEALASIRTGFGTSSGFGVKSWQEKQP
jgi:hypothetical protein